MYSILCQYSMVDELSGSKWFEKGEFNCKLSNNILL